MVHKDGKNSRPYVLTIHSQHFSSHPVQSLDVSADSLEELTSWATKIREAAQNADARVSVRRRPRGGGSRSSAARNDRRLVSMATDAGGEADGAEEEDRGGAV